MPLTNREKRRQSAAVLFVGLISTLARAEPRLASAHAPLRYDPTIDLPITLIGGGVWIASEVWKNNIVSASCRWCDRDANGTDRLNDFDAAGRGLRWANPKGANEISNVIAFVGLPAGMFGLVALAAHHEKHLDDWMVDGLVILEATILAADLNQTTKFLVQRERPFVHALPEQQRSGTAHPSDNNLSFFSGHTTMAFALAASSGTVATLRGYSWAPAIWTVGATLATTTGYLRIAADKHYVTDVLGGFVIGSAVGFAVPWFFHRPRNQKAETVFRVQPAANGKGVVVSGTWLRVTLIRLCKPPRIGTTVRCTLKRHSARHFNPLTIDPLTFGGKQRSLDG